MGRGSLTEKVKEVAKKQLGVSDFTRTELRLMPYLHYTLMNSQRLSEAQMSDEEMKVLVEWKNKGYILTGITDKGRIMFGEKMSVTKEFYDAMVEILYHSYVNYETEE